MHLLACKSCARQYDVTHLPIDGTVHCQCDSVLVVPPPRKLLASALLCAHCGGAVGPDDDACPYCAAAISELDRRETVLCPHCFARIARSARHCVGCGVRIRPTALRPLPEGRACPRCTGELRHRALGDENLIECAACGGLWLEPGVFAALCQAARTSEPDASLAERSAPESAGSQPASDRPPIDHLRYIPCVDCGELMTRRQYTHAGLSSGVVIDLCRHHGVWLDDDELAKLGRFLRGADAVRLLPGESPESRVAAERALRRVLVDEGLSKPRKRGLRGLAGEALLETLGLLGRLMTTRL